MNKTTYCRSPQDLKSRALPFLCWQFVIVAKQTSLVLNMSFCKSEHRPTSYASDYTLRAAARIRYSPREPSSPRRIPFCTRVDSTRTCWFSLLTFMAALRRIIPFAAAQVWHFPSFARPELTQFPASIANAGRGRGGGGFDNLSLTLRREFLSHYSHIMENGNDTILLYRAHTCHTCIPMQTLERPDVMWFIFN